MEHLNSKSKQKSVHIKHPLMLANICAKYDKNQSRTEDIMQQTQGADM